MIDLSVLNTGNLVASVVGGFLAGGYLTVFHPPTISVPVSRRALLSGWYFGFLGSILYVARITFAVARDASDPAYASDLPRITAGWALWLLFSTFVAISCYLGGRWRAYRFARRADAGLP